MKQSKYTTKDDGKLLERRIPKGENLHEIQIDETKAQVLIPAKRQMNIRTKFAMGINKVLRRYMTGGDYFNGGAEDRCKKRHGSQANMHSKLSKTDKLLKRKENVKLLNINNREA